MARTSTRSTYEPTIQEGTVRDHRGMPAGQYREIKVKDGQIVSTKTKDIRAGETIPEAGIEFVRAQPNWILWGSLAVGGYALWRFFR